MSTETCQLLKQQDNISNQLDMMFELRNSKKFCDVTLIVEEEKFDVHKVVLASSIPYFREMFSNDKYQECNEAVITLSELDPKIMKFILGYIYGRQLQITKDNVNNILHHADYLMIKDLKDWCEGQLTDNLTKATCIANFLLSRQYKLQTLNKKTQIFFNENLANIYLREDFAELSKEEFSELWSEVDNRERAYLALMEWIKHDLDNRKGFLHELLKKLPQDVITFDFFKSKIENDALLKENHQCSLWLLELVTLFANKAETAHKAELSIKQPRRTCQYCRQ